MKTDEMRREVERTFATCHDKNSVACPTCSDRILCRELPGLLSRLEKAEKVCEAAKEVIRTEREEACNHSDSMEDLVTALKAWAEEAK
jgi:DNA-directed RNA polymerase subunit RPC12/RpoP